MSRSGIFATQNLLTPHLQVYKGAHQNRPAQNQEEGASYALVMRLLEASKIFHHGHHLGIDNYFTSPKLALDLYEAHITCMGTVRKNRKGLPSSVKDASLRNKEVCERRKGNLLCAVYKDGSKQPILISTKASAGFTKTTNSKGKQRRVPKIVQCYNKAMGGVDMSDAHLYKYLDECQTMK
ncbi:PiggyBac transposable element-derived protein 4 [Plakobranchus ocellatus]|uniref:PiggyBac transposable element-derived protein 4 n=1 Tax=Plakobranchus ocellatus TaxID=259542 RepID=A0AAV4CLM4_9GAST|nr:PiggyBac transposable element-derived protein 4 [Plakobranchus ocellatus]